MRFAGARSLEPEAQFSQNGVSPITFPYFPLVPQHSSCPFLFAVAKPGPKDCTVASGVLPLMYQAPQQRQQ